MSNKICILCGSKRNTENLLPDDIESLQAESQSIDDLVRELNTRHALIRRKLNKLSTPTCSLPPELLSTIFSYAYPSPSFSPRINLQPLEADEFAAGGPRTSRADARAVLPDPPAEEECVPKPITLGAVCTYWRQVAWSTPHLWSALDLHPIPSKRGCDTTVALLHLYARNVGPIGLKVQVVFHWTLSLGMDSDSLEGPVRFLGDALCSPEILTTIRMLILSNPPAAWIPRLSSGFVNLHTLVIIANGPKSKTSTVAIANVPSLRHVSLRGIRDSISLPSHQLLSLTLRDIPMDLMFQLLLLQHKLISYRTRSAAAGRNAHIPLPPIDTPITFHDLQHFEWGGNYTQWTRQLQYLRFPSLRYLHVHDSMPLSNFGLLPWFDNLPSTLKTLHFTRFWEEHYLMEMIRSLPQIETVIVEKCDGDSIQHLLEEIKIFSQLSDSRSSSRSTTLPNLRRLKIEGKSSDLHFHRGFPSELSRLVAEVLPQRVMAFGGPFCLEIDPATMVQWSREVIGVFRDLIVDGGTQLSIIVGGEEVNWAEL